MDDMNSNLVTATVYEPGRGMRMLGKKDMEYAYRHSVLKAEHGVKKPRRVVLSAELELIPNDPRVLSARSDAFNTHRKETQPAGATMGSVFKNPEGYYAGYLIEAAGLKGLRIGGAHVSHKHANFFLNDDDAMAEDIRDLIAEAWNTVFDQFQVRMETEIEFVGDWYFGEENEKLEMSNEEIRE